MTKLTAKQQATIDQLLEKYPTIVPEMVRCHYERFYFARNWFVWIESKPGHFGAMITRCDHPHTAAAKVQLICEYIAQRKAAQS